MTIKDALKFVKSAVGKSDDPTQAHYSISNGVIKSYNGIITMCSPIPIDIEATPVAIAFNSAIAMCDETTTISSVRGKLKIKSGPFKANIECLPGEVPYMLPEGVNREITCSILPTIKKLIHIVPKNSPQPWNRGMLFDGNSVFVTNNVVIVQHWHPEPFPHRVNVPEEALRALIRINTEPISVQIAPKSITFHFDDNKWLKTKLLADDWPQSVETILNADSEQTPIPPTFFDAIEGMSCFTDETKCVELRNGKVNVRDKEISYDVEGLCGRGFYATDKLLMLKDVAKTVDLTSHTKPSIFFGDALRGAIIGMI
jgi:hypothetical protein